MLIHVIIHFNQVQIPDKRLDDGLDPDDGDGDELSDTSSTIEEEIRDDEDKVVRPCQRRVV